MAARPAQGANHTQRQRAIQAELGAARVVLPVDLLEFDAQFAPAVRQALGRALLVEDDDLAAEIVRRHGVPCVTLTLTLTLTRARTRTLTRRAVRLLRGDAPREGQDAGGAPCLL